MFNVITCISLYYPASIGLTFYQQWFIRKFHFPLFVVFCHFIIKFLLSCVVRLFNIRCRHHDNVRLRWGDILTKVAPTGIAAAADIGLSNWSYQYVTISLYTMAKSTAIIFILLFSVLFSLERLRLSVIAVVALVSTGLFLFTYTSTQFHLFGFILVECAAFSSGIRWALSQFMMQRKEIGLDHPIDLMFYLQPWLIGSTLPFALLVEGISLTEMDIDSLETMLQLIVVGGLLSFLLEITEYLLLYYTSGITLSVCNIAKEIVTLIAAHFFKHDVLTNTNFLGLLLLLSGIVLHVVIKSKTDQDEETSTKSRVIKFSKLDFKSLDGEAGSKNTKSDLEVLLHRKDDDEEEF